MAAATNAHPAGNGVANGVNEKFGGTELATPLAAIVQYGSNAEVRVGMQNQRRLGVGFNHSSAMIADAISMTALTRIG